MSVPQPRFDTVKYAGVLVSASPFLPRIAPRPTTTRPLGNCLDLTDDGVSIFG
jgi:hypothetical protein